MWPVNFVDAVDHKTVINARYVGIAVNTSAMESDGARADLLRELSQEYDLPAVDPVRDGVAPIVDLLEAI